MAKKTNAIATTIKTLLENRMKPIEIARKLHITKQRVNYWVKTPIKTVQCRKKKLEQKYIDKIISLARNQTTSSMSSRKIASIMNEEFKRQNLGITISKDSINRYLKAEFGKPRKIRKVFHLTNKQKKERVEFCEKMLEMGISGKQILFTDETQIKTGSFINDSIRLSPENKEKLKTGKKEAFDLINRAEKKFESSIMVAGGICSKGLSKLILVQNTVNEFAYAQALLFFKEDFDFLKNNSNMNIYFEQDGATPHTSQSNQFLIKKLFGDNFIQNPPNSPDLAYPIENIWGYLKPKIKKRNPKNLEELKKFTLEEWNSIPESLIKKCGEGYIKRLKKIIELKGERLEPYHLNLIQKELNKEPEEQEENQEQKEKRNLPMKIIYNDKRLGILKKKEIANLRKRIKELKEKYKAEKKELGNLKARDFKLMGVGRAEALFQKKKNLKPNKEKKIKELNQKIEDLQKMDIPDYLRHTKFEYYRKKKKKDEIDEESTIDDSINKILKIREIEDENIKFELEF